MNYAAATKENNRLENEIAESMEQAIGRIVSDYRWFVGGDDREQILSVVIHPEEKDQIDAVTAAVRTYLPRNWMVDITSGF